MKRHAIAILVYLVVAAGVGAGSYANNPYKGNSIAVFEAAGLGLVWPFVAVRFLVARVGNHYGKLTH